MQGSPVWMAPEVIRNKGEGYDTKCDVWSFGIYCIDLAEGQSTLQQIKEAMLFFKVGQKNVAPPELKEKDKWSEEFQDFISCCLKKEAKLLTVKLNSMASMQLKI